MLADGLYQQTIVEPKYVDSNMLPCAFGALVLVLVDAVLILTNIMPKGAAFATVGDVVVWAILYLTYLGAMSIAMYPGSHRV